MATDAKRELALKRSSDTTTWHNRPLFRRSKTSSRAPMSLARSLTTLARDREIATAVRTHLRVSSHWRFSADFLILTICLYLSGGGVIQFHSIEFNHGQVERFSSLFPLLRRLTGSAAEIVTNLKWAGALLNQERPNDTRTVVSNKKREYEGVFRPIRTV